MSMKKNMSKSSCKSMKKKIVLLLSLVTMACMLFTGCGSTKIVETSEKEVQVDDTQVTGTEVADTEEGSRAAASACPAQSEQRQCPRPAH